MASSKKSEQFIPSGLLTPLQAITSLAIVTIPFLVFLPLFLTLAAWIEQMSADEDPIYSAKPVRDIVNFIYDYFALVGESAIAILLTAVGVLGIIVAFHTQAVASLLQSNSNPSIETLVKRGDWYLGFLSIFLAFVIFAGSIAPNLGSNWSAPNVEQLILVAVCMLLLFFFKASDKSHVHLYLQRFITKTQKLYEKYEQLRNLEDEVFRTKLNFHSEHGPASTLLASGSPFQYVRQQKSPRPPRLPLIKATIRQVAVLLLINSVTFWIITKFAFNDNIGLTWRVWIVTAIFTMIFVPFLVFFLWNLDTDVDTSRFGQAMSFASALIYNLVAISLLLILPKFAALIIEVQPSHLGAFFLLGTSFSTCLWWLDMEISRFRLSHGSMLMIIIRGAIITLYLGGTITIFILHSSVHSFKILALLVPAPVVYAVWQFIFLRNQIHQDKYLKLKNKLLLTWLTTSSPEPSRHEAVNATVGKLPSMLLLSPSFFYMATAVNRLCAIEDELKYLKKQLPPDESGIAWTYK